MATPKAIASLVDSIANLCDAVAIYQSSNDDNGESREVVIAKEELEGSILRTIRSIIQEEKAKL